VTLAVAAWEVGPWGWPVGPVVEAVRPAGGHWAQAGMAWPFGFWCGGAPVVAWACCLCCPECASVTPAGRLAGSGASASHIVHITVDEPL
jgi:hypothetical protein